MLIVAKMIPYRPGPNRKLGLKKVRKDQSLLESEGQLNLFQPKKVNTSIKRIHNLDPFEQALQLDGKNEELAEKLYLEAINRQVSAADALCNLGILRARRGDTAKAVDCFTGALRADPRHAEAHYNLANMYYDAGSTDLAITHYEIASEMDHPFAEIFFNLALAYLSNGQKEQAKRQLESFLNVCDDGEAREAERLLQLLTS